MKSSFKPTWAQLISLSLMATVATGCGKKNKDDSSDNSVALDTEISSVDPSDDGKTVTITYKDKNENKDVTFKCQVEENGKAAEWTDCEATGLVVNVAAKARYTFRVKALAAGAEDLTPASAIYVANGQAVDTNTDQKPALATKILNKGDVSATYDKSTLTLNFGVDGGNVNIDDIRFECKLDSDTEFRRCPAGESYEFNTLQNGQSYGLEVRAIYRPTNDIAASDRVQFTVALADCAGATTGSAPQGGLNVDPSALPIDGCGNPSGGGIGQPTDIHGGPQTLQIGKSYSFTLLPGYHVTEYSTTETPNRQLLAYNVTKKSDPFYIGNLPCDPGPMHNDILFPLVSPAGQTYEYCETTPTLDLFKYVQDFRVAFNHLEVATDSQAVNEVNHDFISFNSFDTVTIDAMRNLSTFQQQCAGRQIYKMPRIRMIDRGFWSDRVTADFYMCSTDLVVRKGGGLPFASQVPWQNSFWVGAFFLSSEARDLPLMQCWNPGVQAIDINVLGSGMEYANNVGQQAWQPSFCGQVRFPNLLELTFISKTPNQRPEMFAAEVQAKLQRQLQEIVPMIHP